MGKRNINNNDSSSSSSSDSDSDDDAKGAHKGGARAATGAPGGT